MGTNPQQHRVAIGCFASKLVSSRWKPGLSRGSTRDGSGSFSFPNRKLLGVLFILIRLVAAGTPFMFHSHNPSPTSSQSSCRGIMSYEALPRINNYCEHVPLTGQVQGGVVAPSSYHYGQVLSQPHIAPPSLQIVQTLSTQPTRQNMTNVTQALNMSNMNNMVAFQMSDTQQSYNFAPTQASPSLTTPSHAETIESSGPGLPIDQLKKVVALREMTGNRQQEKAQNLFPGGICPRVLSCEFSMNNSWNPTFDSEDDSQRSYRYLKEDVREVKGQASMACIKDTTWRDNISKHTEAVVNGVKQPTSLINQPTSPGQEVSQEPVSPPALDSYICMVSQYSSLGGVGASLLQQQPGGQSTHRHTGYSEQNTPQMQLIYQPGSSRSVPGVINMSVVSQQDQHSPKLQPPSINPYVTASPLLPTGGHNGGGTVTPYINTPLQAQLSPYLPEEGLQQAVAAMPSYRVAPYWTNFNIGMIPNQFYKQWAGQLQPFNQYAQQYVRNYNCKHNSLETSSQYSNYSQWEFGSISGASSSDNNGVSVNNSLVPSLSQVVTCGSIVSSQASDTPHYHSISQTLLVCGDVESNPGPGSASGANFEDQRSMYVKLFHNIHNLDLFQIKSNLDLFSVQYLHIEDTNKLRNILKKELLEEILKNDDDDREFFATCLGETVAQLAGTSEKAGYPCCLLGCKYLAKRHQYYIVHVKRNHPNIKNIPCNFGKKCKRNFSAFEDLINHVKQVHSRQVVQSPKAPVADIGQINIPVKCSRISCGGKHYPNLKELMTHYNSFHSNEERDCIFLDCRTNFHSKSTMSARNHFKTHKDTGRLKLKTRHLVEGGAARPGDNYPPEASASEGIADGRPDIYLIEDYDQNELATLEDAVAAEDSENDDDDERGEEHYMDYYSDFLNRLAHFKFVPQSTIQNISEEIIQNTKKSLLRRETVLKKSLKQIETLSQNDVNKIVQGADKDDPFLKAQLQLNTEYKRKKYIQQNPHYVSPKEIILNKTEVKEHREKKDVVHYIPIIESFKTLIQDPSFNKMVAMRCSDTNDEKLIDIKDGSHYKQNAFFKANPEAYCLILYSDAVEMKNPLGAARGTYKIVQVYYTLCEIEKAQRSQIDRFQLLMIFREKLLKKYSYKTIYKNLVEDLKKLELGVVVNFPMTRRVKCGILCYSADNLEASLVGGFSACFSSKDICRVCHIEHHELEDNIHDVHGKLYSYWSVEEYDRIIQTSNLEETEAEDPSESVEVNPDNLFTEDSDEDESDLVGSDFEDEGANDMEIDEENIVNKRGIKSECCLNVLASFHSVEGFPNDILHDVFEGRD